MEADRSTCPSCRSPSIRTTSRWKASRRSRRSLHARTRPSSKPKPRTIGENDASARAARDLRYWEARRATAHIVHNADSTEYIRFGHTVKLARDDGREQTFRIVGEDESDPAKGKISHVAPLARALFGKSVGEVVRVRRARVGDSRESASNAVIRTQRHKSNCRAK